MKSLIYLIYHQDIWTKMGVDTYFGKLNMRFSPWFLKIG